MANVLSRYLTGDRRQTVLISILVTTFMLAAVGGVTVYTLHKAGMRSQEDRLIKYVESQARMVEAILAFDSRFNNKDHPLGEEGASLSQVIEAHESFNGFGETGAFTMAKHDGNKIVYILCHRNFQLTIPKPVNFTTTALKPCAKRFPVDRVSSAPLIISEYRYLRPINPSQADILE